MRPTIVITLLFAAVVILIFREDVLSCLVLTGLATALIFWGRD